MQKRMDERVYFKKKKICCKNLSQDLTIKLFSTFGECSVRSNSNNCDSYSKNAKFEKISMIFVQYLRHKF